MKLAIVTRCFPPDVLTGRETVIYNLWQQALKQDDVTLVSGWQNDRTKLPKDCLPINQSSSNRIVNYTRFFVMSSWHLFRLKPDVVLSNAIEIGPSPSPVAVIAYDFNFGKADGQRGTQLLRRYLVRFQLAKQAAILAISQATGDKLVEIGIRPAKVSAINIGVDLSRFTNTLRATKGGPFEVAYPARFVYGKGQHVAIEAIKLLPKKLLGKIKLILVGYAQDREYLTRLKYESQSLPVEFHQDVDDVVPYYQNADLIIFPTIMEEGFGYTAAEALSCGKAVVYSDYPAIREATGGIGVGVPPGDASALSRAIERMARDDQLRDKLATDGYNFAQQNYDWASVYQKYRNVFKGIASR